MRKKRFRFFLIRVFNKAAGFAFTVRGYIEMDPGEHTESFVFFKVFFFSYFGHDFIYIGADDEIRTHT